MLRVKSWVRSLKESVVVRVPAESTKYTKAHCMLVKLTPLYHIFANLKDGNSL